MLADDQDSSESCGYTYPPENLYSPPSVVCPQPAPNPGSNGLCGWDGLSTWRSASCCGSAGLYHMPQGFLTASVEISSLANPALSVSRTVAFLARLPEVDAILSFGDLYNTSHLGTDMWSFTCQATVNGQSTLSLKLQDHGQEICIMPHDVLNDDFVAHGGLPMLWCVAIFATRQQSHTTTRIGITWNRNVARGGNSENWAVKSHCDCCRVMGCRGRGMVVANGAYQTFIVCKTFLWKNYLCLRYRRVRWQILAWVIQTKDPSISKQFIGSPDLWQHLKRSETSITNVTNKKKHKYSEYISTCLALHTRDCMRLFFYACIVVFSFLCLFVSMYRTDQFTTIFFILS